MNDFKLKDSPGFLINVTALKLKNALERGFSDAGHDITTDQWAVMIFLWKNEGHSQSEIADELVKDKTNITRILDLMEKKGLIERLAHESDRRICKIYLTGTSRKLLPGLIKIAARINNQYTSGLTAQEIEQLKSILRRLYAYG